MVSAGVRRRGGGVSMRMVQHFERVELAHHCHGWSGITGLEHTLEARQGNAFLKGDTKIAKLARHEL
jgi:hypothetical protein